MGNTTGAESIEHNIRVSISSPVSGSSQGRSNQPEIKRPQMFIGHFRLDDAESVENYHKSFHSPSGVVQDSNDKTQKSSRKGSRLSRVEQQNGIPESTNRTGGSERGGDISREGVDMLKLPTSRISVRNRTALVGEVPDTQIPSSVPSSRERLELVTEKRDAVKTAPETKSTAGSHITDKHRPRHHQLPEV